MKSKVKFREAKHDMRDRNRLLASIIAAWIIPVSVCMGADLNWRFVMVGDSRGGITTGVNDAVLSELVREILTRAWISSLSGRPGLWGGISLGLREAVAALDRL